VHTNEHTNGFVYSFNWDRRVCNIINQSMYSFCPVKGGISPDGYYYGRRGLAKWVVSEDRDNDYLTKGV